MTWVRLETDMMLHPKIVGLNDRAFRLHISGICYASRFLTDGVIPKAAVPLIVDGATKRTASQLVQAGVWHDEGAHYRIHDYLDYQPTADHVREIREARAEAGRRGGQRSRPKQPASNLLSDLPSNPEAKPETTAEAKQEAKSNPIPIPIPDNPFSKPILNPNQPREAGDRNGVLIKDPKIGLGRLHQANALLRLLPDADEGTAGRLRNLIVKGNVSENELAEAREAVQQMNSIDSPARFACSFIENRIQEREGAA